MNESKVPTDEDFERLFAGEMASFRGTEQEITVMKAFARKWFVAGDLAVVSRCKYLIIRCVDPL